jgi:hypothetical protein
MNGDGKKHYRRCCVATIKATGEEIAVIDDGKKGYFLINSGDTYYKPEELINIK